MLNKIFLFIVFFCFAFANDPIDNQSKLVYIKQEVLKDDSIELNYIGEIIAVKYNIIVLDNASVLSVNFLNQNNVIVKNPDSAWRELEDGSLENIFYFKINAANFTIPRLEVAVRNDITNDVAVTKSISNKALNLYANHPNYAGVIAKNFKIKSHNVKNYDDKNNIIILDLEAEYGNLEDFKLKNIQKQGFESSSFGISQSSGIFYAILPVQTLEVSFEYFDLTTQSYKIEKIKNILNQQSININQEIKPINKELIFQNIVIISVIFILIILFFIKKIPLKVRFGLLVVAIILAIYVILSLNTKTSGNLKTNSYIRILPTSNSTIITQISTDTKVEIIGEYGNYYKVSILDGSNKTGWVKRDDIK